MDNFFEILIYLIIIVSFLSSLFKKKEPDNNKPKSRSPVPDGRENISTSTASSGTETSHSESYDILKEIENIFKENMGIPAPSSEQQKKSEELEADEKYEQAFQKNYDLQDNRILSAENRALKSRENVRILDEKTISEADKFEELLLTKSALTKRRHPIVEKIHNPESLREFILISEILGKPAAYKR